MPEHPLLLFPEPTEAERSRPGGGGARIRKPSAAEQRARLDEKFRQIAQSFQRVQATVQGIEPEQVLVLETIGEHVTGLAEAVRQIPGMEWLAEMDLDDVIPEGGFADEDNQGRELACRLYAVMTNQQGMDRLLGLWNEWTADPAKRAERNFGPFKNLFINLRDLRRWNAEDRIRETGLRAYVEEMLEEGAPDIQFEVELWCRQTPEARNRAYQEVLALIEDGGGQAVAQAAVPEILYHGVLVRMAAAAARAMIQQILDRDYGTLIRCDRVMFVRPFAQAGFLTVDADQDGEAIQARLADLPPAEGNPIVGILDGLPFEQHEAIRNRLLIEDPDEFGPRYQPSQQRHGTAMASLVVHGDLNDMGQPLRSPVYVRPILAPKEVLPDRVHEVVPDDELLVDLVHRAVRTMLDGDDASAPTVRIINLSVANRFQPFDRELSPLARLLDWLSWKHKVLFLVSAGNHGTDITVRATAGEWRDLSPEARRAQALHALRGDQVSRRPYSPAEAVNPLSVGAIHADSSGLLPGDRRVDLIPAGRLPSPIGCIAHGYRRSIKPEIFLPGGRQLYMERLNGGLDRPASFSVSESLRPPGQRVAAPAARPLELARTVHTRGTSNATALATRCGAQIAERLAELRGEVGGERLDDAELAVLVKCLLVHGASWGDSAEILDDVFRDAVAAGAWRELQRLKTRFLGYGELVLDKALSCTGQRVTALGWSRINVDQGHVYHLPLPPALSGTRVRRRLTATVAWLTPVNPRHRSYRRAQMWCNFPEGRLGVSRAEVDADAARRGTVEHRVLEGDSLLAVVEGDTLDITISCKEDGGEFEGPIPYAVAVTLEVAEALEVSIYEQVRELLRQRVKIEPGG